MNEYDQILKEKKVYQDPKPVQHSKYTKYVVVYFLITFLILVGSYLVYYHMILSPMQIFINDFNVITSRYQSVFSNLQFSKMSSNYTLEGTLNLEEQEYNYEIIRDHNRLKVDVSNQESHLFYFVKDQYSYLQLSALENEYVQLERESFLNLVQNLKNNFTKYVTEDQYIKSFYWENQNPVVEVNLSLSSQMLQKIFSSSISDHYDIILTLKNNAFTNEIMSVKLVVNNRTQNSRQVLTYQKEQVTFVDSEGNTIKFILKENKQDFSLKIYREEVLYSVLTGTKKEDSYQYTYQIIDEFYTLNLLITDKIDYHIYKFSSSIEKNGEVNKQSIDLILFYQDGGVVNDEVQHSSLYSSLTEEEKETYDTVLEDLIGPLRKFVDEY